MITKKMLQDFRFQISDFRLLTLSIVFSAFSAFAGAQTCSSPFVCGTNPNCSGGQQADLKLNGQGGLQTIATFSYCDGVKFFKNLSVSGTITATSFVGNGANLTNAAGWAKSGSDIVYSGNVGIGTTDVSGAKLAKWTTCCCAKWKSLPFIPLSSTSRWKL